jgi:DNA repair protein RadC
MRFYDLVDSFVTIQQVVEKTKSAPRLHSTKTLAEILGEYGLSKSVQEELWVIPIDGKACVRTIYQVAKGGYHDTDVSIPTILSPVFLSGTDRFAIAHNHPSGHLEATQFDIELTHRISEAADLLELTFEDHLIVTPDGSFISLYGKRLLRPSSKVSSK